MNQNYKCPRCHNEFPLSNKTLHDLKCTESNPLPFNNQNQFSYQNNRRNNNNRNRNRNNFNNFNNNMNNNMNNYMNNMNDYMNNYMDNMNDYMNNYMNNMNDYMNNNMRNMNNYMNNNMNNNLNNNIVSSNTNTQTNPDGTTIEIKTDTYQNGIQRIKKTKYDQNHNIIYTQTYEQNNNNFSNFNNFNNFNSFNNNNLNNNNNNVSIQTETDAFGNTIETRRETFPDGRIQITKITRDRNGQIIGQSVSSSGNNNFNNNMQFNMGMNMMNNMNMMNMMNNINNMDDLNLDNGVDSNILNRLEVIKIRDVSNLDAEKKNCVICLEEFKEGDDGIYLPCFHLFHKNCINEWLRRHDDCPVCKFKLTYENMNLNN